MGSTDPLSGGAIGIQCYIRAWLLIRQTMEHKVLLLPLELWRFEKLDKLATNCPHSTYLNHIGRIVALQIGITHVTTPIFIFF